MPVRGDTVSIRRSMYYSLIQRVLKDLKRLNGLKLRSVASDTHNTLNLAKMSKKMKPLSPNFASKGEVPRRGHSTPK